MANKRITKKYKQRDNDPQKEYQRLVRNTKSKLQRVKENYGLDLSDEIKIPKFQELDTSEKFDEWSEQMQSFTDRGNKEYQFGINKYGVVYSLAQLEQGIESTKLAQENAKEFIEKYKDNPVAQGGKDLGYTIGDKMLLYDEENVAGIRVPKDFNIDAFQDRKRLEGRLDLLDEKASGEFFDQSMSRMKQNFMTALGGTFNSAADEVLAMIDIIPPDDFFELYLMKEEFTFEDYASDGSIDASEDQLNRLKSYLEEYFRGEIDVNLLKGFGDHTLSRESDFVKRVHKKHGKE